MRFSVTWICFCVVCVLVGSVLSRVARAGLLTTEVIIYSIYRTMYVQNRKNLGGRQDRKYKITNSDMQYKID